MSCSSNRKRLVGSCISTFVSSTNSLAGSWRRVAEPGLPVGRSDLRETRVRGAGRVLRSTMGLLGALAGGGEEVRLAAIVTPCRRRTQALVRRLRGRATGCGVQATDGRRKRRRRPATQLHAGRQRGVGDVS